MNGVSLRVLPLLLILPALQGCKEGTMSRDIDRQFYEVSLRIHLYCINEKKRLLSPDEIEEALDHDSIQDARHTDFRVIQIPSTGSPVFEFRSPGADRVFMSDDDYVRRFTVGADGDDG